MQDLATKVRRLREVYGYSQESIHINWALVKQPIADENAEKPALRLNVPNNSPQFITCL